MSETRSLSAREAAESLGVSDRTIRRAILEGKLVAIKEGRSFLIAPHDLERFRQGVSEPPLAARVEPATVPQLIGREREITEILELLRQPETRFVSLIGPGGVGKTSLAQSVERTLAPDMPDGSLFVSLAPIALPDDLHGAIVSAAGLYVGQRSHDEALQHWLDGKSILLVLDNFEHVLAAGERAHRLVSAHPGVVVLATSREPLGIAPEVLFEISPLLLPEPASAITDVRTAPPAVRLFIQRVRDRSPGFVPDSDDLDAVAAIVRRLDGLPLAIELAAAQTDRHDMAGVLDQLEERLQPARRTEVSAANRHQTLSRTIAWSYDLLDPEEQRVFRWLALMPAGVSLDVARWIVEREPGSFAHFSLEGEPPVSMLPVLDGLTRKHLLVQSSATHWSMLETTRAFALAALDAAQERYEATALYLEIYDRMALQFWEQEMSPKQVPWIERFTSELDNVRAVLRWAFEHGDYAQAIRIAGHLMIFWENRGLFREGAALLEHALAHLRPDARMESDLGRVALGYHVRSIGDPRRSNVLWDAVLSAPEHRLDVRLEVIARDQLADELQDEGRLQEAETHARMALSVAQSTGEPSLEGIALHSLGMTLWMSGDADAGIQLIRAGIDRAETGGDNRRIARMRNNLGLALRWVGDYAAAEANYQLSLDAYRYANERNMVSVTLSNYADLALIREDFALAAELATQSIDVSLEVGSTRLIGVAQLNRSIAWFRLGARDEAFREFNATLPQLLEHGKVLIVAEALELYGQFLVESELPQSAALAFGAAHAIWKRSGSAVDADTQRASLDAAGTARTQIGNAEFNRLWDEGKTQATMDVLRRIGYATLAIVEEPVVAANSSLSPRERVVLRLVAEGLTDREIGDVLFVSPRTVATHVARILDKLGVESRTSAATTAVRQGII